MYSGFPDINCKGEPTFPKGKGFMIGKSQRFAKVEASEPGPGS